MDAFVQVRAHEHRHLRGVSGVLRPGRLTLVLGPACGGKSLLMQARASSTL